MSRGINSFTFVGRLVKDAEFNDRKTIGRFTVAVDDVAKNADGKWENTVDFIEVRTFQKGVFDYLKKGTTIAVSGRVKQSKWTDKQTNKPCSRIDFVANDLQRLGSARKEAEPQKAKAEPQNGPESFEDDSIPF